MKKMLILIGFSITGFCHSQCYTGTWEFIYDSKGNWIKKLEYRDGELKKTIEREITYYE